MSKDKTRQSASNSSEAKNRKVMKYKKELTEIGKGIKKKVQSGYSTKVYIYRPFVKCKTDKHNL